MGTVDLRDLEGDKVVIHFGGALTSVDAYTFANSLVSFADAARSVNSAIDPNQTIEIRLEAIGPGSFRAVITRISKGLEGFFSKGANAVLWSILAALIYDKYIADDNFKVRVEGDNQVVIERGRDRIIIDRSVYEKMREIRDEPVIQKSIRRTFEAIANDEAIENFGITRSLEDQDPIVQIDRDDFPRFTARRPFVAKLTEEPSLVKRRVREENARLLVLKLWLVAGNRKWQFEWNGVPVSAPILDDDFARKLINREVTILAGDALDVVLRYDQEWNEALSLYENDTSSFEIVKVLAVVPRGGEQAVLFDSN
ncbi:MAG: hypothetical protein AAGD43_06765 [Pseudomonadota bacterium]